MTDPRRIGRLILAPLLLLGACSSSETVDEPDPQAPARTLAGRGAKVQVQGGAVDLTEVDGAQLKPEELARSVAKALSEGRRRTADRRVERVPDVALELLRNIAPAAAAREATALIALRFDAQAAPGTRDWFDAVQALARKDAAALRFAELRATALGALEAGEPARAREDLARLSELPLTPLQRVEAERLSGIAALLSEDFAAAQRAFDAAREAARPNQPYLAAELALLASDAARRSGQKARADELWTEALDAASSLLIQDPPLRDPRLWERALYLRPSDLALPELARQRLATSLGVPVRGEDGAWLAIGQWRLARGEAPAALKAGKTAEARATDAAGSEAAQLLVSRALIALDQPGAARTLLLALCDTGQPRSRQEALAILGALELDSNRPRRGLGLLRRAVEGDGPDWPGRGRAMADYGLALIINGEPQAGRRWLGAARERFERDGDELELLRALRNELRYLEHTDQGAEAEVLKRRLERLEQP